MKATIITEVCFDDNRSVADQIIESSNAADYIINDLDDMRFLHSLGKRRWEELTKEERTRAIKWVFSDMVYTGVVDFDYTIVCPQDKCCPACHTPMTIFDQPEETGPRFICHDCGLIITMTTAEDVPGCGGDDDEQ